jgi:hypothetical protein
MNILRIGIIILIGIIITSCDECKSYSDFSCKQISKADYNVYFYYSGGSEVYLGQTSSLESCGNSARSFAYSESVSSSNWGYICCMIANGSSCYEKHR